MGRISKVFNYVRRTPWAILPERGHVMFDVLRERARDSGRINRHDVEAVLDASKADRQQRIDAARAMTERSGGAVAVVPITGTFVHRAYEVNNVSGGGLISSEQIATDLRALDANQDVSHIVLDVNSPGGSVYGMPELVSAMQSIQTPMTAVASPMAASAAYWMACQAGELVVTPSGEVGSIGVISMHEDWSKALENEGVEVTVMTSSPYKGEGNPYGPMSEEAITAMKSRLDQYHGMFVGAVAAGRGVTVSDVESKFGGGRMLGAKDAVAAGMADREATLEDVVQQLASTPQRRGARGRRAESAEAVVVAEVAASAPDGDAIALREKRRRRFEMGI